MSVKYDKGKVQPRLIIESMPKAIMCVAEVGTFGAEKYSPDGWKHVHDGYFRYTDAMYRHLLQEHQGHLIDQESQLYHAAHAAWNALARLELLIEKLEQHDEVGF